MSRQHEKVGIQVVLNPDIVITSISVKLCPHVGLPVVPKKKMYPTKNGFYVQVGFFKK